MYRDGREWLLTAAGERYGEYILPPGMGFQLGEAIRSIHSDLSVLEVLGLDWPKPAG